MASNTEKTERIHCNQCGQKTKHLLIASRTQSGSEPYDDEYDITWETIYDLFECRGCDEVTLRRRVYFSEWEQGAVETTFYPPRVARRLPPWKDALPTDIRSLMEEVYTALQADSRGLAMMGARALIDMVVLKEVEDVGTFEQKLKALQAAGFLSKTNGELLSAALDVGNAASHRGYRPEPEHVRHVVDIVEHLLQATLLREVVKDLKDATPKRRRIEPKK